jgi:hypothetical protein
MRVVGLVLALMLLERAPAAAGEIQVRPFLGVTFGGGTTLSPPEGADHAHVALGIGVAWLGDVVGAEAEVAHVPGYLEPDSEALVLQSGVTTITGSFVLTLPHRLTQYTLRPYFVVGGGLLHAGSSQRGGFGDFDTQLGVIDVGGGATGFVTNHVGVTFDVRHFSTTGGTVVGFSILPAHVAFWRASVAVAIR